MKIVCLLALIGLSLSVSVRSQQQGRKLSTPQYDVSPLYFFHFLSFHFLV